MKVTQDFLREIMVYDPLSGIFTAKKNLSGHTKTGDELGANKDGYVRISIKNKLYYAHRLAFIYMNGESPKEIDHIDRNRTNNKWSNLREATHSENAINCLVRANSRTGVKGVGVYNNGIFYAQIRRNGKNKYLGRFYRIEDAEEAYQSAANKHMRRI